MIEEVSNPRRTFPRAVVAGVGMVTLVYLTTNLAFILVLTPEQEYHYFNVYFVAIFFTVLIQLLLMTLENIRNKKFLQFRYNYELKWIY